MTHNYYPRNKPKSTFTFHTVTTEEANKIITNTPRKKEYWTRWVFFVTS